ncbi:MAG: hypothetical protein V4507_08215 [Verrucomicrobiota bacterium]
MKKIKILPWGKSPGLKIWSEEIFCTGLAVNMDGQFPVMKDSGFGRHLPTVARTTGSPIHYSYCQILNEIFAISDIRSEYAFNVGFFEVGDGREGIHDTYLLTAMSLPAKAIFYQSTMVEWFSWDALLDSFKDSNSKWFAPQKEGILQYHREFAIAIEKCQKRALKNKKDLYSKID